MKNFELLRELPFYDDINISRKETVFRGYVETYKVEVINNKTLSDLLYVSKRKVLVKLNINILQFVLIH